MSPTRRGASGIAGLQRGVGTAQADAGAARTEGPRQDDHPAPPTRVKPVRVTLNFPPDLFRQLDGWTREAADAIGAPRVSVQDAVRAIVHVITSGEARNAESQVFAALRRE